MADLQGEFGLTSGVKYILVKMMADKRRRHGTPLAQCAHATAGVGSGSETEIYCHGYADEVDHATAARQYRGIK